MLKISNINNINTNINISGRNTVTKPAVLSDFSDVNEKQALKKAKAENYKAYIPSFTGAKETQEAKNSIPSIEEQYNTVKGMLTRDGLKAFSRLDTKGILMNKDSNDGSTVLENLYKIATQPRIQGLKSEQIIYEVVKSLDNPFIITQKFGDIPKKEVKEIETLLGEKLPQEAFDINSSCCVVASMEFNLASKKPAEFARFAEGLSGNEYSVSKKVKITDIAPGTAESLWYLREFNTDSYLENNWEYANINIKPDRNAIVRARVQASYKDPGERSSVDVLIQSALLNLGSQNTYNALTDERTGKFNNDNSGLTDMEKNFVEQIVFEKPQICVVYQNIQDNKLAGYFAKPEETKQHILKYLELGQNVIIGYTHIDENNTVHGGHEITIIGYKQDEKGNGCFICNDTDDGIDAPIEIEENVLLPKIHHAGISKEALSKDDVISESWREILEHFKNENLQNAV